MVDKTVERHYEMPQYELSQLHEYLTNVLQLEAVACQDWLTNKVDRSVTGKIARQQCQGEDVSKRQKMARAKSLAYVGVPIWSNTTHSVSRSRPKRSIVFTPLFP